MSINNILRPLIAALVMLISTMGYAQQESQYTQFMYNQLYLNPAYAGVREMASLTAIYRNQWIGFEGSPESKLISFNTPLLGKRVGFGLTISNHTIGLMNSWYGSMAYSYKLQITDDANIRFGLQGTMRYLGLDFEDPEVEIRQPNDPSFSDQMESKYTGNFGMGIYFDYKNFFIGASVPNFFPNEITLNKVPSITDVAQEIPHYYLMMGAMFEASERVAIKPALLLKYVENAPLDLDVNVSAIFDYRITVGASYRAGGDGAGDSVDLLAMYQYRNIALGLAYDFGLSELSNQSSGSFEALLRYDFFKEQDDIANPRFFY